MVSLISCFVRRLPRSVPRPWAEGSVARGLCAFYFAAFETPDLAFGLRSPMNVRINKANVGCTLVSRTRPWPFHLPPVRPQLNFVGTLFSLAARVGRGGLTCCLDGPPHLPSYPASG